MLAVSAEALFLPQLRILSRPVISQGNPCYSCSSPALPP